MPELVIGHILNKNPLDIKFPLPLVLRPDPSTGAVVHGGLHLGHPTKMPTPIDAEEQVDGPLAAHAAEGAVQAFVAVLCATPDGVLNGAMDVILRVALDDEHTPAFQIPVKLFRVIAVSSLQFSRTGWDSTLGVELGWTFPGELLSLPAPPLCPNAAFLLRGATQQVWGGC